MKLRFQAGLFWLWWHRSWCLTLNGLSFGNLHHILVMVFMSSHQPEPENLSAIFTVHQYARVSYQESPFSSFLLRPVNILHSIVIASLENAKSTVYENMSHQRK